MKEVYQGSVDGILKLIEGFRTDIDFMESSNPKLYQDELMFNYKKIYKLEAIVADLKECIAIETQKEALFIKPKDSGPFRIYNGLMSNLRRISAI